MGAGSLRRDGGRDLCVCVCVCVCARGRARSRTEKRTGMGALRKKGARVNRGQAAGAGGGGWIGGETLSVRPSRN